MNATEQRVLDAVDMDGLLAYLCDLVAVKSICGDEIAVQEHVAGTNEAHRPRRGYVGTQF